MPSPRGVSAPLTAGDTEPGSPGASDSGAQTPNPSAAERPDPRSGALSRGTQLAPYHGTAEPHRRFNLLTDITAWRDALLQSATDLALRVAGFVPALLAAIVLLGVGWLLARAVELTARRVLGALGLDRAATRLGMSQPLERAGVRTPLSDVIARLSFWLVIAAFVLASARMLGLAAVTATVDRLVGFVPDLVGAGVILVLGLLAARFLGTLVSSGGAAAGLPSAARLGFVVRVLFGGLVVVVALEQLGVATSVLVGPLTAVLAAAGLSAGLTLALGAHPIVTHILAGHYLKQSLPRDSLVEVGGGRGVVERIGATDTLLRDGDDCWSIPNAKLLDLVVKR